MGHYPTDNRELSVLRAAAVDAINRATAANTACKTPETVAAIIEAQRRLTDINARITSEWSARNSGGPDVSHFRKKSEIVGDLQKWREDIASAVKNPKTSAAERLFSKSVEARIAHILRLARPQAPQTLREGEG